MPTIPLGFFYYDNYLPPSPVQLSPLPLPQLQSLPLLLLESQGSEAVGLATPAAAMCVPHGPAPLHPRKAAHKCRTCLV